MVAHPDSPGFTIQKDSLYYLQYPLSDDQFQWPVISKLPEQDQVSEKSLGIAFNFIFNEAATGFTIEHGGKRLVTESNDQIE